MKRKIIEQFSSVLNETSKDKPRDIKIKAEYQFTRSQPASATVVSKKIDFVLYNQTFEVTPAIK